MFRVVLTGAPSSGKTTTALEIARLMPSWLVHKEIATSLAEQGARNGDEAEFTLKIIQAMILLEEAPCSSDVEIFDRALPDSITYLSLTSTPFPIAGLKLTDRYDLVFNFAPLPFFRGEIRNDFDLENFQTLVQSLPDSYRRLNYSVVEVPVGTVEFRAGLVIRTILERQKERWSINGRTAA